MVIVRDLIHDMYCLPTSLALTLPLIHSRILVLGNSRMQSTNGVTEDESEKAMAVSVKQKQ